MSSLLNLFSLLSSINAGCETGGNIHPCPPCGPKVPERLHCGPVCPDICLVEPGCVNEILCKLQIGFFIHESNTTTSTTTKETLTTVSVYSTRFVDKTVTSTVKDDDDDEGREREHVVTTITTAVPVREFVSVDIRPCHNDKAEVFTEHIHSFVPLKIFKIHERKDACCTSNSVVITFVKPCPKPIHQEYGYLVLSPKGDNSINIPHIFATTFNKFIGIEQQIIHQNHQVVYRIPLRDIESVIVSITDLGIANVGAFKRSEEGLDVFLESDIFTHGPYKGFVPYFSKKYAVPHSFKFPTNTQIRLAALHKDLCDSIKIHHVSKWDINRMAVAAFISEIRWLFSCSKAPCVKKCEVVEKVAECERVVVDYCVFVSACIKAIAYCEEKTDCRCVFTPQCTQENRHVALQSCVNVYASKCELVNVQLSSEISVLFSDVCPALDLQTCEPTCDVLPPLLDESCESSSSLSSDEELIKERTAPRRKAAVKVKTETSVSTYGWYVAGGVVAVSVAVVVYVFVL